MTDNCQSLAQDPEMNVHKNGELDFSEKLRSVQTDHRLCLALWIIQSVVQGLFWLTAKTVVRDCLASQAGLSLNKMHVGRYYFSHCGSYNAVTSLWGIGYTGTWYFFMGGNFCDFLFAFLLMHSCLPNPFKKGVCPKGQNLLLLGANSFLWEQTSFQRGTKQFGKSCLPWKYVHSL